MRVDLPEAGGDRGGHPQDIDPPVISRRMRLTREMFERVWCHCPMFRLFVRLERGLGTWQTTLSDVAGGLSRSLRWSLKALPRSLVTEN